MIKIKSASRASAQQAGATAVVLGTRADWIGDSSCATRVKGYASRAV